MSEEIPGVDVNTDDEVDEWSGSDFDVDDRMGTLTHKVVGDDVIMNFQPRASGLKSFEILRYAKASGLLSFRPRALRSGSYEKQFRKITELQIENPNWEPSSHSGEHGQFGLLYETGLPKGFGSIYAWGLGISRDYRGLLDEIEDRSGSRLCVL